MEVLALEDVGAWQFRVFPAVAEAPGVTRLEPLLIDADGIAGTAFNASISQLVEQTLSLKARRELSA